MHYIMSTVHILDYVAGNVRSLVNAIEKLGYTIKWIKQPEDIEQAEVCDIDLSNAAWVLSHLLACMRLITWE